jgi:hypothetical protein
VKELVQAHNVSYYLAFGVKENKKNLRTTHLSFCIRYCKLGIGMSAAYNLS